MSTVSSKLTDAAKKDEATKSSVGVTWNGWVAVIVAIVVFLVAQIIAAQIIGIYPAAKHWSQSMTTNWLNNSVPGQFFFYAIAETLTVLAIIYFIRWRKGSLSAIGLTKPKGTDVPYAFLGFLVYFPLLIVAEIPFYLFHLINLNQQQALGFNNSTTGWPLILVFLSLVVMPAIAEEIMFRGFVYSGLKRSLPMVWAVLITCAAFAFPHLLESTGGGPLWAGGIDTFVLSLVLIWLREKTGRLYAGMGLHGLKNFIAFLQLYPVFHIHL